MGRMDLMAKRVTQVSQAMIRSKEKGETTDLLDYLVQMEILADQVKKVIQVKMDHRGLVVHWGHQETEVGMETLDLMESED